MAWGSETALGAGDTAVANTWTDLAAASFTTANPYDVYHFSINADNSNATTVTDKLEIRVLTSPGTNFDNAPVFAMSFDPTVVTDEYVGFTISGYYKFKVQVRSSGATDTYDVTASKYILYSV